MNEPTHSPQQPSPSPEETARFGPTEPPGGWLPPQQPAPAPVPGRGSRRLGVGVVAASVLLGGLAGVGGAAGYQAWNEPDLSSPTSSAVATPTSSRSEAAPAGTVEEVADRVLPSVVRIDSRSSEGSGSGSGIVLSEDGQILTNDHVVGGEGARLTVSFHDGTSTSAEVVGTDPLTDTAVIQADDVSGLTPVSLGSSGDLSVGQAVVAIGSPFGLDATVTSGIVSALDRPVSVGADGQGNTTAYPAIQTDAAINPGNSGGPLVDMAGNLVGINASIRTTQTMSSEAGSIGLGFAIPVDAVLPIVEQIREGETPTHARLGITVSDVGASQQAEELPDGSEGFGGFDRGLPGMRPDQGTTPEEEPEEAPETDAETPAHGALVGSVAEGSTAEKAGLAEGDVITGIDDRRVTGADSLVATVRSYRPGQTVTLTWIRDGEQQQAEVELGSDADSD